MNFENVTCDEPSGPAKAEPAALIMEDMDVIIKELGKELSEIDDAIYSPSNANSMRVVDDTQANGFCLLGALNRQRYTAQRLLDTARHIREGLC